MRLKLDDSFRLCLPMEMVIGSKLGRWVVLCPKEGVLEVKSKSNRTPEDIVYEVLYLTYKKWLTLSDEMLHHLNATKDDVFEVTFKDTTLYIRKDTSKKTDA